MQSPIQLGILIMISFLSFSMLQFFVFFKIISYLIFPLGLIYYYIKAKLKRKNIVIKGRIIPPEFPDKEEKRLWMHGVSVGEILSLYPLAKELREKGLDIVVSTTTSTGMEVARKRFKDFFVFYFPFDLPFLISKYLKEVKPDGIIIAETELWPNFLLTAKKMNIPIFLVNGRMSASSYVWYKRFKGIMRKIMDSFTLVCVQSQEYRRKFIDVGAPENKVVVTGNMKADFEITKTTDISIIKFKYIIAGSTMDAEEDNFILKAFKKSKCEARLIIAPRHPERAEETFEAAKSFGFNVCRRTQMKENWDVMVLDTMGELAGLYSGAKLSIIGGSIKPYGGHNLLEPAYFGSPIAFGLHMENFNDLAEEFIREGAALIFKTENELASIMKEASQGNLALIGEKGKKVLNRLKGASRKNAELILSKI